MPDRASTTALAVTAVGAVVAVVLMVVGRWDLALWAVVATMTLQPLTTLIRRTGRAASPPARTEIRRTTRGDTDG